MRVNVGHFDEVCIRAFFQRTGLLYELAEENADLILTHAPNFKDEEHYIFVGPSGIQVNASAEAGVAAALTTVYKASSGGFIPHFSLKDFPKYSHRGFMLDCSRHFFPLSVVKKVIEEMSLLKLNAFHWHLTDDQGWRIESKEFPELTENSGYDFYTQDEIREVVSFAKERGVDVIPEIDLPGHTTALLRVLPWLSCKGKAPEEAYLGDVFSIIACAGKEESYNFLEKLLGEACGLFESKYFHIGGDEAPKTEWMQCPNCNAYFERLGLSSFEDLQGHFTCRMAEFLRANGKTAICWNDVTSARELPDDLVIQYWNEFSGAGSVAERFSAGRPVIFSDLRNMYFDYPQDVVTVQKVYSYSPALGELSCSQAPNALGIQACLWSELFSTEKELEERMFPRIFALAENAWSNSRDYSGFMRRMKLESDEAKARGVRVAEF
jgi:hexosaminidase